MKVFIWFEISTVEGPYPNWGLSVCPSVYLKQYPIFIYAMRPLTFLEVDDDDEFRFNDASTHEGHLRQNGKLTWFCNETAIKVSYICIKCKTRTNLKIKAVR